MFVKQLCCVLACRRRNSSNLKKSIASAQLQLPGILTDASMEDTGTNAYDDITVKKIDGDLKVTEEDNNNSGWGWFVTFKNDSDDKHLESHR